MSVEDENNVQTWLASVECNSYFVAGLLRPSMKDSKRFPGSMFEKIVETISLSEWWSIVSKRNERMTEGKLPEGFAEFLAKLHTCTASSGSIERIFSSFGLIWSKVRNRLGSDKAHKLVKVYIYYRSKQ